MIEKGIAVIGSTTIDHIIKKNAAAYTKMGGVTTYSGITYSRHGIVTHVATNIATRDLSLLKKLTRENIHVHNGFTENTTQFENRTNGERRRQRIPFTAKPIKPGQIIDTLALVDGVHLGPLHPLDIEVAVLPVLNDSRLSIFLDIQGYVRKIRNNIVYPAVAPCARDALAVADVVKADEMELNILLRDCQTNLNGLMTNYNIKEFIVSRGDKGGWVKTSRADETFYQPAPVANAEDSTGAGDVFFAAYIIGRFVKNEAVMDACSYAAGLSAQQVEGRYIKTGELGLQHIEG